MKKAIMAVASLIMAVSLFVLPISTAPTISEVVVNREAVLYLCPECGVEKKMFVTTRTWQCSDTGVFDSLERRAAKRDVSGGLLYGSCLNSTARILSTFDVNDSATLLPNLVFVGGMPPHIRDEIIQFISEKTEMFDMSEFTLKSLGLGARREIAFDVYYNDILLNPSKYSFVLRHINGILETEVVGIWGENFFEKVHQLCFESSIHREEMFRVSRAFGEGLLIPDTDLGWFFADNMGEFKTTDFLGSIDAELVIYCLDELKVAYRTEDFNEIMLSEASVALVRLFVYVDTKTGDVLGHQFEVDVVLIAPTPLEVTR